MLPELTGDLMRPTLLTLSLLAAGPLSAQDTVAMRPALLPPSITTAARGEARITPDRAMISIGVHTRAATAAQAGAENARKQKAVIDALRAKGISPEQISTTDYNIYPQHAYNPQREGDEAPRIIGYNVTNTVRVDVRKIDQVGSLIDVSLAAGANQVSSLEFYSSNVDDARRSALAAAVARARGDAEAMARAAGGSLGRLLELSSVEWNDPRPMMARGFNVMQDAKAAPTPIEPGQQTLSVSVSARWMFSPAR
jgi:uncharacterized protein YggE